MDPKLAEALEKIDELIERIDNIQIEFAESPDNVLERAIDNAYNCANETSEWVRQTRLEVSRSKEFWDKVAEATK
jgi:hypothetical protein